MRDRSRTEALRVQFRETIRADGSVRKERLAFCAEQRRWVGVARCGACADCAHLSGDSDPILLCRSAPVPDAEELASVRAALARSVWCIEANAPANRIDLMPGEQAEAIVVDEDGHAIGLLSREAASGGDATSDARALMQPVVVSVLQGAPLDRAREILSMSDVKTVPVVQAGRVVGRVDR